MLGWLTAGAPFRFLLLVHLGPSSARVCVLGWPTAGVPFRFLSPDPFAYLYRLRERGRRARFCFIPN